MTQKDRDRLVALKKAKKKLITQRQAAEELGLTERHVRRLLVRLRKQGDAGVVHGLRGRPSNRKLDEATKTKALAMLKSDLYRDFGPTLAGEYLAKELKITVSRETVRAWKIEAGLWHPKRERMKAIHVWRARRPRRGELIQWDTSEHAWLEGRGIEAQGQRLYLISMIDDATSRLHARFVLHDSTAENMRLLWSYLERNGRPLSFYTDKAGLFKTAPKIPRDQKQLPREERDPLPPTQIGRALSELSVVWLGAHSPQAKGRVERSFGTAQDRLVKGLRVAGAKTLKQANTYLEAEFIPWWNQILTVEPASADDAHRPLDKTHSLAASLSCVEPRQVHNDYTIQFDNKLYQIDRKDIRSGLRKATVRVEMRLDDSIAVRFRDHYLTVTQCARRALQTVPLPKKPASSRTLRPKSQWMQNFHFGQRGKNSA